MKTLTARWRFAAAIALVLAFSTSMVGCAGSNASEPSAPDGVSRDYGATDPCQFTVLNIEPKPGADLKTQGQKIVDGFEGFEAIGDVTLYPEESKLEVTWCNSMQTEQGVMRAVSQTNLATIVNVVTTPNEQK